MTESRCIPIEELAHVRHLPADSPERSHAESCPRCRASLLALAEFERADEALPAEAGAARARARLDAVIESLTTVEPLAPASPASPAAAPRRDGPGWLARLFAPPALRFATAFAVVAVVAASAWFVSRGPADRMERGESRATGAPSVRAVDGGWRLTWPAVEGADAYDVVFLSTDLREVARVADVPGTELVLARGALPAGVAPGVPLIVEIDARSGGSVLQVSPPAAIEL